MHNGPFAEDVVAILEEIKNERATCGKVARQHHVVRTEPREHTNLARGWVLIDEDDLGSGIHSVPMDHGGSFTSFLAAPPASIPDQATSPSCKRSLELYSLLLQEKINIPQLRRLAWFGVPMGVRGTVWKLVLGYLPPDRHLHEYTYTHRRSLYRDIVQKHYKVHHTHTKAARNEEDDSPSPSAGQCTCFNKEDRTTLTQIELDVPRTTLRGLHKGLYRSIPMHDMLVRLLYVWAKENSDVGYVQGLNDLPIQFILVFLAEYIDQAIDDLDSFELSEAVMDEVEADAFWCLSLMMAELGRHFAPFSEGMHALMVRMGALVRIQDQLLYEHMQEQGCDLMVVALRWMICLLSRELTYDLSLRLWDAYFSHGPGWTDFHLYVCAAFITTPDWSAAVQKMEFSEMVVFLQQPPTHEWSDDDIEDLLLRAYDIWLREHGRLAPNRGLRDVHVIANYHPDEQEVAGEDRVAEGIISPPSTTSRVPDLPSVQLSQINRDLEFFRSLNITREVNRNTLALPDGSSINLGDEVLLQRLSLMLNDSDDGWIAMQGIPNNGCSLVSQATLPTPSSSSSSSLSSYWPSSASYSAVLPMFVRSVVGTMWTHASMAVRQQPI
eukprot:TRINITY_DN3717_c0_g1_i3.p1 TRINITY_DN3717_c0_g1~~TRINITY_DN3717_c0_g1_i3.p1  ORF type:complete len:624 (+),score=134.85 TRINITY_DN3717_c0_g1_i3:46-1872(+)